MIVFFLLVVVLLIGLTAAVVTGRIGGVMADPVSTSPFEGLVPGRLAAQDVTGLRFDLGLRGYRMDQVDAVLDRLADELAARDEELAALRASRAATEG
ncbi:MAG: DivIVA domain-containing protein [Oryzihumus sp.]